MAFFVRRVFSRFRGKFNVSINASGPAAANANVSAAEQDKLGDSCFAYVESGGKKDAEGKTVPRSKRHLLLTDAGGKLDAAHVRAAEDRFNQTRFESDAAKRSAWSKIASAAKSTKVTLTKKLGDNGQLVDVEKNAARPIATHSVLLADGPAPEWIEVIPPGTFAGYDGRGPWHNEDPQAVIDATMSDISRRMKAGLPVDFDHATDFAAPEGRPAPSYAWMKAFEVRNGAIWAQVEWTAEGAAAVEGKHYRYFSPVFQYDPDTSAVTCLMRGALTNNPNLELTAIAAADPSAISANDEGEQGMDLDKVVAALKKTFPKMSDKQILQMALNALEQADDGDGDIGDAVDGSTNDAGDGMMGRGDGYETEEMCLQRHAAAAQKRKADNVTETAEQKAQREAKEATEIQTARVVARAVAAARGNRATPNATEKGIASHPMVRQMATEISELKKREQQRDADIAVNAALKDGKITPALKEWATNLYMESPKLFKEHMAKAPTLHLEEDGSFRGAPPGATGSSLSTVETAICANLGIDQAKFGEAKKNRRKIIASFIDDRATIGQ